MKKIIICLSIIFIGISAGYSQTTAKVSIYNPSADAIADIKNAVAKASSENKQVLIQVGGNWCPWCVKFHKLINTDQKIDSLVKANYIFILVNYSKENKNFAVLKQLEFPQRFGYPVLVILDKNGKRLHTQDSGLLESGDGYDSKKVFTFLKSWSVASLDPANYPEK
jgi:thioredoxin-related protein